MTAVAAPRTTSFWSQHAGVVLTPRRQVARAAFVLLFIVSVSLLVELLLVSGLQQRAAQQRMFDSFRSQLAEGTAPTGPYDADGRVLPLGSPVAYLEIPEIGVRQVVGSGTTGAVLFDGPGHRRDTPLPGQNGASLIMGRKAAFGGPFAGIDELVEGDPIRVTTGQGVFDFEVMGVRHEGDPAPPMPQLGEGRLTLVTATGTPFMPSGVIRVDAELEGEAVGGVRPLFAGRTVPKSEQLMGADTSSLWALVLWLQALIAVTLGAVWAWHRWGRAKAWVVSLPILVLVGVNAAGEAARLMPNLL